MDPLQNLTQELAKDFSTVVWTPNAIVGWTLCIGAIVFAQLMGMFAGKLKETWVAKQVAGLGKAESASTKLRKLYFPFFTNDPNDELKPYLPYWAPFGLGMTATQVVGIFIP